MPLSPRPARVDVHGYPLPEVAAAREQSLLESRVNRWRRRVLQTLLDELYKRYLRRGQHVEIQLNVVIQDGTITDHVYTHVTERLAGHPAWRVPEEE